MLWADRRSRIAQPFGVTQFEALQQFDEEERKIAKALLESLILKHNAKRAFTGELKNS